MKRIIAVGRVSAGKTTLARHPRGISLKGHKDADGRDSRTIDRHPGRIPRAPRILPGFGRPFCRGRGGSAAPILHRPRAGFPPGVSAMFARPAVGVVAKTDLAQTPDQIETVRQQLMEAGAERAFPLSSVAGEGAQTLPIQKLNLFPTAQNGAAKAMPF